MTIRHIKNMIAIGRLHCTQTHLSQISDMDAITVGCLLRTYYSNVMQALQWNSLRSVDSSDTQDHVLAVSGGTKVYQALLGMQASFGTLCQRFAGLCLIHPCTTAVPVYARGADINDASRRVRGTQSKKALHTMVLAINRAWWGEEIDVTVTQIRITGASADVI